MLYYIYDKINETYVCSIQADSPAGALKKYADEIKLENWTISHSDTLKTSSGFAYWAVRG